MADPAPRRFRKRPVVIEAIQYAGPNWRDVLEFIGPTAGHWHAAAPGIPEGIKLYTLEGNHEARPGDWIIKGIKGEFYPCKPDIFAATYESVEGAGPPAGASGSDADERAAQLDGLIADLSLAVGRYVRACERSAGMADEPELMRKSQANLREWVAACFREIAREEREQACAAVCRGCRNGWPFSTGNAGPQFHVTPSGVATECDATAIRALAPEPSPPRPPAPDREKESQR